MCGVKPHLMTRIVNNLGAETRIGYASSTQFYLADKADGHPWVSRLPFPVHVVERVETYDHVGRNRFVTRYTYHHGFYDGQEREFRGFGLVDQIDTEEIAALTLGAQPPAANQDPAFSVPPVLTKTWFHTGLFVTADCVSRHLADEYYREGLPHSGEHGLSREQTDAMLLEDTILPPHLSLEEAREACRALKGSTLRQEVYALDGKKESCRPYSVTESSLAIRVVQRRGPNRYAVFFTHAREDVSFNYERRLYKIEGCWRADPRVSHTVTLQVDDYGNVRKSMAIAYGRRFADPSALFTDEDRARQHRLLMTLAESDYTNAVDRTDAFRTPLPAAQRTFELTHLAPDRSHSGITNLFTFRELSPKVEAIAAGHHDLPYANWCFDPGPHSGPRRRLLRQSRTVYRADRLDRLLPLGHGEVLALPGDSYALALTADLLRDNLAASPAEVRSDPVALFGTEGGYVDLDGDGNWWTPSGRISYAPEHCTSADELLWAAHHFFNPRLFRDPFGNSTTVGFDAHDLMPVETTDAVGSTTRGEFDYRTLAPRLVTDINGNRTEVVFDTSRSRCGHRDHGEGHRDGR